MVSGLGASIAALFVGAILDFAVTPAPSSHGVTINAEGAVLMIVGAIGVIVSAVALRSTGRDWRHRAMP
ncbi:MAG TPA: hypothetical protein VIJ60_13040 [Acidimicrobiales bacterium]|jgi:hypothetical protein